MNPRIKTCYIAAPAGTNLKNIREALYDRDVRLLLPFDQSLNADDTLPLKSIRDADLVIGVLTQARRSQWVLFELGQAVALKKQILIIAPPKSPILPPDLQRWLVLRVSLQNRRAIDFALDQLLAAPKRTVRPAIRKSEGLTLGAQADQLLSSAHTAISQHNGRALEEVLASAIRHSGVDVVVESASKDRGTDLAVWSDALQSYVGNPLLIEVKLRLGGRDEARSTVQKYALATQSSGSAWGLLIYGEGPSLTEKSWVNFAPTVLAVSVDELIGAMRDQTFVAVIRDLRNRRVHGIS